MNINRRHFLVSVTTSGIAVSTLQAKAQRVKLPEPDPARWGSSFSAEPHTTREYAYRHGRLCTIAWRSGDTHVVLGHNGDCLIERNLGLDTRLTIGDFQTGHAQDALSQHVPGELVEEIHRELEFIVQQVK